MSFNNQHQSFTTIFNDLYFEFINCIVDYFPNDATLLTAKKGLLGIRKLNPKLIFRVWDYYVVKPYRKEITECNIDFFINKDYSQDLGDYSHDSQDVIKAIDRFREPVKNMNHENQLKIMVYLQSLAKLSDLNN